MKKKEWIPLAGVAAAVTTCAAIPAFVKPPKQKVASEHGRNWMSVLRDDVPLSHLAIPGTHDSASEKIYFAAVARCQHLTILQQLEAGCRFLDLRLAVRGNRLILVHGLMPCISVTNGKTEDYSFDELSEALYAFLKRNPTETVLVSVKCDRGDSTRFADIFYERYLCLDNRFWYTENRMPVLGEVRGKAVLVRRFPVADRDITDQNGGLNLHDGVWPNMAGIKTFGYRKFHMERLCDGSKTGKVCLQDCYGLGVHNKWFHAVKPLLDRGRYGGEMLLNFLSCTGRISPAAAALPLNRLFSAYDMRSLRDGGIFVFDFADAPLAEKVYCENRKYICADVRYPANNDDFSRNKQSAFSAYLSGYSNLIYRIFDVN